MSVLDKVKIELTVVLGEARMPIHQLLRMGRGAVIELNAGEDDDVTIYANNTAVAKGQLALRGDTVAVAVTQLLPRALGAR